MNQLTLSVLLKHAVAGLACIVFIGCNTDGSRVSDLTKTEQLRLQLSPEVGSYMARSELALQNGNINLSFALVDSAEALAPALADVAYMRGRLYRRINDMELSSTSFLRALELDPEYKGAWYSVGMNAFQTGRLQEAVGYYRQEEELHPEAIVYLALGKAYARLGEPDSARIAYEMAIEMDPSDASTYMWLGQLYEETGDLDKAIEYSLKGAEIKPGDPEYEYILGSQYLRIGDLDRAIEYLEPVAGKLLYHQGVQYNLGQALMRRGEQQRAQAHLALADSAQQLQQAVNEAQNAINSNPSDRDSWVEKSQLLWKMGQREEAIADYMVATNIDPTNLAMQSNLAMMMVQHGDFEQGIARFEQILQMRPDLTEVWANLGAAYANNGQFDEARAVWEQGLSIDPGNAQIKQFMEQLEAAMGS